MPHSRRMNSMAGTSTPYEPAARLWRPRITSHGSLPGAQQHQGSEPGIRATPHKEVRHCLLAGFFHDPEGFTVPGGGARRYRSTMIVTGPSLTRETFISAPKTPVSTRA